MNVPSDTRPPREKGFSKDADKLVRRLSLVAFLLCRAGRPATAGEIRHRVEGYALMTDEAFKRRFYEDRTELGELGIEIVHQSDEAGDGDLYSLHGHGYYLPAIDFSADELSALAACLFVLGDRFAYSEPLRLALFSLTHDRPELLADEPAAPVSILPEADARRAAAALPKVQEAVAARKAIRFTYYSIARDEELERTVDPYSLLVVGDEWYLIGRCHLRDAVRTFRLSRLRSPVRYVTKAPHDFAPPPAFELAAYVDRPPWQLGPATGQATVRVSPAMAWWVEAHYGHCGTIAPAADGGIDYTTDYHTARQLLAWTLSMGEDAELASPAQLRTEIGAQLRRLSARLDAPPLPADEATVLYATTVAEHPAPATRRRRARAAHDWQVEVDRFTRLTTLMTYLEHACRAAGGDEVPLAIDRVRRDLDLTRDDLVADVRLLNLVNFGGEGTLVWAEVDRDHLVVTCEYAAQAFARPARLSPLQVDTLLLAVELLGGQLPTEHGAALRSAAGKLRRARSAAHPTLAAGDPLPPQEQVLAAVNRAVREHRLLDIDYWSAGTGRTTKRTVEPCLIVRTRSEWYYVTWCRKAKAVRAFRVATTKRARLRDETFAPRPDAELELYRREGVRPSTQYASRRALVWYSPAVARWIAEREPVAVCDDGACLAELPYVDERWLVHELLRFGGEAVPLSPAAAVRALADAGARLGARYADGDVGE